MKIKLSIFVLVITQITASFSSELRKAVLSVENSFERLLTDVATDVRDTITCTLMAIEQAFKNDQFDMNSDYYKKCGGTPSDAATGRAQSRQQVNDQKPQRFAYNARSRLADVTRLLKQEIDKISEDIRKRFKKFTFNENDPSIENVWQSIKILHEIGKGNQNSPEGIEVGRVIDKVLDVLDIKEGPEKTENDKIEDVINNLVQNSSDNTEYTKIKSELNEWKHEDKTLDIKEGPEKTENHKIEDVTNNLVQNSSDNTEFTKTQAELNEWKHEDKTLDIKEGLEKTENDKIEDVTNNLVQNSSDNTEFTKTQSELIEWKHEYKTLDIKGGPEKTENDKIEDVINSLVQNSSDSTELTKNKSELNEWKNGNKPLDSVNSETEEEPKNSTDKNVNNAFPRSFKEVVKILNNETQPTVNETEARNDTDNNTSTINKVDITTRLPPDIMPITTTQAPIAPTTELTDESEDYDSFFGLSSNKNRHKNAVRQANQIIEDSKRAQMILDSFFKSASLNAKNVFDDPDLMEFK